jgi:outer membrane biosynthesis protein TonB
MELTYATIVVLASMVFVLSGMVGYLYWQQTRMLQHIQSLAIVISTQLTSAPQPEPEPEAEEEQETKPEPQPEKEEEEEDDRVSVKEEVEHVTTETDVDDLQDKTSAQLREMLTKKGIPFGKRDAKTVLIQLLKATA